MGGLPISMTDMQQHHLQLASTKDFGITVYPVEPTN